MNENAIIATCKKGMEEVLKTELESIGAKNITTGTGSVSFDENKEIIYKANMALRTAIHILKPLKTFYVSDYDNLYQQAKKINWRKLFTYDKSLRIDAA